MKKNRNMITKLVSMLLLIAMLVLATETTVIALADDWDAVPPVEDGTSVEQDDESTPILQDAQASQESVEAMPPQAELGTDVFEVVEYRDANVKHFSLSNEF